MLFVNKSLLKEKIITYFQELAFILFFNDYTKAY